MKMANILVVAALCIPFLSCGKAPEPQQAIEIEPNSRVEQVRQAPIQKRIYDKMGTWCEDERAYLERELSSGEAQESSKYRTYLRLKLKNLLEKCETRYKK